MSVAEKEEPYDVFISFKNLDENKNKTEDSEKADRLYHELRLQGYRVFYSNITLAEEYAGEKYEPYIYAALHSAKAMVVVGTRKEYFEAPWVKNEWSRYLKIINKEHDKKIFPCYKNMYADELPAEFKSIEALDMDMLGFMDVLFKRIAEVVGKKKEEPRKAKVVSSNSVSAKTEPLIKRAWLLIAMNTLKNSNTF